MFGANSVSLILAFFLGVWCLLVSSAHGEKKPGFKARISQNGLDFLTDVGIQVLKQQIHHLIANQSVGVDIGIGNLEFATKNITSLSIPSASLTTNPTAGGLTLKASGIGLAVDGALQCQIHGLTKKNFPKSGSGYFSANGSSISLAVAMRIGVDSIGRPSISLQAGGCAFNIGDLDVSLQCGSNSLSFKWLHNPFDDWIEDVIKHTVHSQICDMVIDEANDYLQNELKTQLPMVASIGDIVEIDYSLVESPSFKGSVNTAHKGELYPVGLRKKSECPLHIPIIPPDSDTSRMVFIWITEFLPNSVGCALQNIGFLQYNITPDNVPAGGEALLNTSNVAFELLIPEINRMYPNMAMQINVNSTKAPMVKISSSGVESFLVGDFTPSVILPNKTLADLFTLHVEIIAKVSGNSTGNTITWNIPSFSTRMSVVHSAVGPVPTGSLTLELNSAIKLDLVPYLNGITSPQLSGFSFNFTEPVFSLGEGFLKMGTNVINTPPSSTSVRTT